MARRASHDVRMLLHKTWHALGTTCELTLATAPVVGAQARCAAVLNAAEAFVHAAEQRFSRFIPTSELCQLNAAAGDWFVASVDLYDIVTVAFSWTRITHGLFDPTILPALRQSGYDRSFETIAHQHLDTTPSGAIPQWPAAETGLSGEVTLDPERRAIRLPRGAAIDLGGIGKGWIADAVMARVLGDLPDVLINLGGDLVARGGPEPGHGWIIAVRDPRAPDDGPPRYLGGFELTESAVATSGAGRRWWVLNGVTMHHLIDPRTGRPAAHLSPNSGSGLSGSTGSRGLLAATALVAGTGSSGSGAAADVRAKTALLAGRAAALASLDGGLDYAGLVILGDGSMLPSANLAHYLSAHGPARPLP